MNNYKEKPFEYLTKKSGGNYKEETIRNWYIARAYVLHLLKQKDIAFKPDSTGHLHVVAYIDDDRPLMLSVVRHMALYAHFLNFQEEDEQGLPSNRTVITIVSNDTNIKSELEKEEHLCNLPKYCKYSEPGKATENPNSYIDIEINVVRSFPEESDANNEEKLIRIHAADVLAFLDTVKDEDKDNDIFSIDTRMAVYASRLYQVGVVFQNIPSEDIHCAERYSLALDIFQYKVLSKKFEKMVNDDWAGMKQTKIKEKISNIFCSDCFSLRENSIILQTDKDKEKDKRTKGADELPNVKDEEKADPNGRPGNQPDEKDKAKKKSNSMKRLFEYLSDRERKKVRNLWEKNNEALSRSEHVRWVVEKLILGYRPLDEKERFHDDSLHVQFKNKDKRKKYRDSLKQMADPAHIDLCSYRNLRRTNPDDMKYDSFLMLAIPFIIQKVKSETHTSTKEKEN